MSIIDIVVNVPHIPGVKYNITIHEQHPVTIGRVLEAVEIVTGVSQKHLESRSRMGYIVRARMLAAYVYTFDMHLHPKELGAIFNRDRTTGIFWATTAKNFMDTDQVFQRHYQEINKILNIKTND